MDIQQAKEFLKKLIENEYSLLEQQAFRDWVGNCSRAEYAELLDVWENVVQTTESHAPVSAEIFERLEARILQAEPGRNNYPMYRIVAVAAVLFLVIGLGLYKYNISNYQTQSWKQDIPAGSDKAYLTLSDGRRIQLNNTISRAINVDSGGALALSGSGELIYQEAADTESDAFNTIETPKGGQYRITLSDGSRVWINAGSVLKYPVSFVNKKQRLVELQGEAYFEVSKDPSKPFTVKGAEQEVQVLGTHFNVNTYTTEPEAKTTLLEGSIALSQNPTSASALRSFSKTILKPGQQARIAHGRILVEDVNTDMAIAWKNGYFMFNNESLESIMRRIARWYDVEVVYEHADLKAQLFSGSVSRFKHISALLEKLELTGPVKFEIINKRVIVKSN